MNILLMMMGGNGSRFGADRPKQFTMIQDKPLFLGILEKYCRMPEIDRIVVVSHVDWAEKVRDWCSNLSVPYVVTEGGTNRSQSVRNGLRAAAAFASSDDVVLIHDATHPYVDREGTLQVIERTKEEGAATLANFNYDTVYRIDDSGHIAEVIPRTHIVNGASPEAFRFGIIYGVYQNASEEELERMTSAGAIALSNDIPMAFVQTDILNLKITYQRDMQLYRILMNHYF